MTVPAPLRLGRWCLPALVLGLALLATPGCGSCCDDRVIVTSGNVYVDNLTDLDVPEWCIGFFMRPVGGVWTGDLLIADLPPATTQFVGTFTEDFYDAEAEMEFSAPVPWDGVFVPAADDTFFEIY